MTLNENIQEAKVEAPKATESSAERNFGMLRRQLEEEREARRQTEQRLAAIEKQNQSYREPEDSPEPYVDHKLLDKRLRSFESDFEKKVEQKAEEKARLLIEQEKQQAFLRQNPDFHQILSPDMIKKFADTHPDVAEEMLEMPDNFARQKLLYKNIKALGLHKPAETKPSIQSIIEQNKRSPFYQPSGGTPPYAAQGDFSSIGQKTAYEKMQALISGRRAG